MADKWRDMPKDTLWKWVLRVLQGTLIGIGGILPGISGGVLCVSFGLYQPIMSLLAHPLKQFKKQLPLLLPVGIGGVLGFFAFAKLILLFFNADSNMATSLFLGLIVGTFPGLFKQAGKQGRKPRHWVVMVISFLLISAGFWFLSNVAGLRVEPGILAYGLCGAFWGLSVVVPGMSSSAILIFLGLYEPMTAGVVAFDMAVLVPMGVGVVVTLIMAARLVNRMFERHYGAAFHMVLGVSAASTLLIIPWGISGVVEALGCLALAAAGFGVALLMNKLELKIQ